MSNGDVRVKNPHFMGFADVADFADIFPNLYPLGAMVSLMIV
jgi:hypothetical protein